MKPILITIVVVAVIIGAIWFDYYVWRLQHPTAPGWTFLFSN